MTSGSNSSATVPAWWRTMAIVYIVGFLVVVFMLGGWLRRQAVLSESHVRLRDRVETLESRQSALERRMRGLP